MRMTRGPKATPTHLKILRGNPGKRAINEREPENREGGTDCPCDFDDETRAEWERMVSQFQGMGLWSEEFRGGLVEYCEAFQLKRQSQAIYRSTKQPPLITTKQGNIIQHPLIGTINRQKQIMYRWLIEFGMTPASRTRVQSSKKEGGRIPTRKRA